jgi:xanthine dehydrogenase accessory factor
LLAGLVEAFIERIADLLERVQTELDRVSYAAFPHADQVVVDWPQRYLEHSTVDARTAVCVLTHDAKFDIPLLSLALDLPVGYVGAMGSRRTHEERLRRLREAGVTDEQLARLRSPIGLDLGARTPEETAISITAEIITHANRGTGLPLTRRTGPIHPAGPQPVYVSSGRRRADQSGKIAVNK